MVRVLIIPGMGCTPTLKCNWYNYIYKNLIEKNITCIANNFPDPYKCSEKIWISYIKEVLKVDKETILIGHSTGSEAILRLLEDTEIKGAIIVSAYHTDLGDKTERESGYFNRPWKWDLIRKNYKWLAQWHSKDDHLVPYEEARYVAKNSGSEYFEYTDNNHFLQDEFPELLDYLLKKIDEN